ncbi:MAG: hypothetical protein FJZ47_11350 [Candidatus Tectomicrobia bacterium]|uniref:Uncharacterized protein n=1 Tax=Tectimicrobiota bacterium TaxID=2528274 RepID=A0A938B467_UNCTE|nr:hypothetical protein [Candidatus Tectomicrobia bacterium]
MAVPEGEASPYEAIDTALQAWRQGDCVLGEQWFVHRFDPACPLTDASVTAPDAGVDLLESAVSGFVVLTQTCDLVRRCRERPFVEVAPLVEVSEAVAREIERGRRPLYAAIPALRPQRLVADLDRTMTVEKAVVAQWTRIAGCRTDQEARRFTLALMRKRGRFAFPDDFTSFVARLQARLLEKHDRQSEEGRALRALREIRVQAIPSWEAPTVELTFWFIRTDERDDFAGVPWYQWLDHWLQLLPSAGRFTLGQSAVVTLADLTAKDYVDSDPLDLDYLSTRDA